MSNGKNKKNNGNSKRKKNYKQNNKELYSGNKQTSKKNVKKGKKYFLNDHNIPQMLFADATGNIYDHPYYLMSAMSFDEVLCPGPDELITLPYNSKLFFLPEVKPVGYDPFEDEYVIIDTVEIDGREIEAFAVSVFLPPGYARIYLPGADYSEKTQTLPLWSYTAVGMDKDEYFYACAFLVENNYKWDPKNYDDRELVPEIKKFHQKIPENMLMNHLRRCATEYHCFAAKNLFLRRWEAPLPVAKKCNSRCLGCLSLQKSAGTCASHQRINFKPDIDDIVELAVPHLENAEHALVSFGQGCEGEPLTEWELIRESIIEIRKQTKKGSINLNTNGSLPDKIEKLINAGLDSIRVSMNSVLPEIYTAYFRPVDYYFKDVIKCIEICRKQGLFTMINYLIFPGVTDTEEEYEGLCSLIENPGVDFIHFKNLCIDPDYYISEVGRGQGHILGIRAMFELLNRNYPGVDIGYFNKNIKRFIGYD